MVKDVFAKTASFRIIPKKKQENLPKDRMEQAWRSEVAGFDESISTASLPLHLVATLLILPSTTLHSPNLCHV